MWNVNIICQNLVSLLANNYIWMHISEMYVIPVKIYNNTGWGIRRVFWWDTQACTEKLGCWHTFSLQTLKPNCPGIHSLNRTTHTHFHDLLSHSKDAINAPQHTAQNNGVALHAVSTCDFNSLCWESKDRLTSISKTCSLSSRKTTRRANRLSFCGFPVFSEVKRSGCFLLQLMSPSWTDTLQFHREIHSVSRHDTFISNSLTISYRLLLVLKIQVS